MLAYKIKNEQDLDGALERIRKRISIIADPFDLVLSKLKLPDEFAAIGGRCCIGEAVISGNLHTVEGYVFEGEVHAHGIIDSLTFEGSSSFLGYRYPSSLPCAGTTRADWRPLATLT